MPTTTPGSPGADPFAQARLAARELGRVTGTDGHDAVVVLGTGLYDAAEALGATGPAVDLTMLPWFARFTGPGHRPEAWSVARHGLRVLVVAGRLHLYEGRSPAEVVHLVRTAVASGVRTVVLTCSAGAINPSYRAGDIVAISDHLNLTGASPLTGVPAVLPTAGGHAAPGTATASGARPGTPRSRHADLIDAWSPRLRSFVAELAPGTAEGVYAQVSGPELETPAEIRMLAALGADLVGMSTVHEAIAARHLGADVLGLAVASNPAAGTAAGPLEVEDIVAASVRACPAVAALVGALLDRVAAEGKEAGGAPAHEPGPALGTGSAATGKRAN